MGSYTPSRPVSHSPFGGTSRATSSSEPLTPDFNGPTSQLTKCLQAIENLSVLETQYEQLRSKEKAAKIQLENERKKVSQMIASLDEKTIRQLSKLGIKLDSSLDDIIDESR